MVTKIPVTIIMNASPLKAKRSHATIQLFTYEELAQLLRCCPKHIRNLTKNDPAFPIIRIGNNVRFDPDEVIDYLRKCSGRTSAVHPA